MTQALKNIILFSLCASFCTAVSPSDTENSQNATVSQDTNLQILNKNNNKLK